MVNRWKEIAEGMREVEKHGFEDEEPDLYTVDKVSKCDACDSPAVCYLEDRHHPDKPKGRYLCEKHKFQLEQILSRYSAEYEVRYLE